jgi:hypothetical protein
MSVSILETLIYAEYDLDNCMEGFISFLPYIKKRLHDVVTLLDKGYNIYTQVEPLLEKYGDVENVPEIDENDEINQDD